MVEVGLVPWADGDLGLLARCNTEEMTRYLGGPESAEALVDRHLRYLRGGFEGRAFAIVGPGELRVGSIGFWAQPESGSTVWETGWAVVPEAQGRGIAAAALAALVAEVAAAAPQRPLHAYPRTDNVASNAVCRRAGFELLGEIGLEYPKGNPIRCHDWCLARPAR